MKTLFLCLLFVVALHADFSVEKIFSTSYERGDISIHQGPDVVTGVDNFYVAGDNVYLLQSTQQRISQYSLTEKKFIKHINIPAFAIDIAIQGEVIFVITSDHKMHIVNSREVSSHNIVKEVAHGIHLIDNTPVLHLANGYTMNPKTATKSKGWQFSADTFVYSEKISENLGKVVVIRNDVEIVFDIPVDRELGSIVPVGLDGNKVFIRLELLESSSPIVVSQQIICLDTQSRGVVTTNIPNIHNNYSHNDCKQVGNQLLKMMLTPQGVDIVALKVGEDGTNGWGYSYTHHYNDHLLTVQERVGEVTEQPTRRISRTQIIWNAEDYLSVYWSCSSKNTTGLKTLPDGSKIRTPSWVTSGTQYRIPYKWGGFSKVSVFKQKTSQGKYAGSNYTKSVSWGDTYCVGVDCSGFVSRAWGTSSKYGTSTIGQVSSQLSSISKLKKGDALNKRGSHIVLVIENNPSGTVNVIEASGIDWAVSKRRRNLSSMSSYKPIAYDYVSEWK